MAQSVGAAAAQGIESGFGLGLRAIEQQERIKDRGLQQAQNEAERADRAQERAVRMQREARLDDRQAAQDKRQARLDALGALDKEFEDLGAEGTALWTQYGGFDKVPEDVRGAYTDRVKDLSARRRQMRQEFYAPEVDQQKVKARENLSRMQTGELDPLQMDSNELATTLTAGLNRSLYDLLSRDDQPAPVLQAFNDAMTGLETDNGDLVVKGANVLFAPEIATGIGTEGRDGNEIVAKELYNLVPHPQDPQRFVPLLKVTTQRADGSRGTYVAPATVGRTSDPNAQVLSFSMDDALQRGHQLATAAGLLNRPEIRAKLDEGLGGDGGKGSDEFLSALRRAGVKEPQRKLKRESRDLGDRLEIDTYDEATGKLIGTETRRKGVPPGTQARIDAKGKGKGGGGAGAGAGGLSEADDDTTGDDVLKGLSESDRTIVKGLADGTVKAADISTKGDRREKLVALAKRYKPGVNLGGRGMEKVPQAVVKPLQEARSNAATLNGLKDSFKDNYASKGVLGLGADASLAAKGVLGTDTDSVDWWKNYRKMAELVERHAMFGASLTAAEQGSWKSADIHPSMAPSVIKKNLATRAAIADKVLAATAADAIDAGYNAERINAIAGRDVKVPLGTDGGGADMEGGPPRVTDDTGYNALPSGTLFIGPDGKTRRKP